MQRQKVCIYSWQPDEKTCNGGHRTIKKGASTDPKKHFEVINFILGHFVNFLEEIYQENFDVSSPLTILSGNSGYMYARKKNTLKKSKTRSTKRKFKK